MKSTNDTGQTPAALTAAALTALQTLRAGSSAPIIVIGVSSINNSAVSATESAVNAAVQQMPDFGKRTFFIPVYGDQSGLPWITCAWNNTADTSSVNASVLIKANDNVHPTPAGTAYFAARIVQAIRTQVLPKLAVPQ